jgi:hypothetical protein
VNGVHGRQSALSAAILQVRFPPIRRRHEGERSAKAVRKQIHSTILLFDRFTVLLARLRNTDSNGKAPPSH